MAVVDFSRMKRLELPPEPGSLSLMTKVYLAIIVAVVILLVKRYRDIRKRHSSTAF